MYVCMYVCTDSLVLLPPSSFSSFFLSPLISCAARKIIHHCATAYNSWLLFFENKTFLLFLEYRLILLQDAVTHACIHVVELNDIQGIIRISFFLTMRIFYIRRRHVVELRSRIKKILIIIYHHARLRGLSPSFPRMIPTPPLSFPASFELLSSF